MLLPFLSIILQNSNLSLFDKIKVSPVLKSSLSSNLENLYHPVLIYYNNITIIFFITINTFYSL